MRSRRNILTLGDLITVKCALGLFHEAMILSFQGDEVLVHLPTHGNVSVPWSAIS